MPPTGLKQRATQAANELVDRIGIRPQVAMLLGTGHSSIAGQLKSKVSIPAGDLPEGMHRNSGAALLAGEVEGVRVMVADAPLASYEGFPADEATFPVRVFKAMGAELLVLTAGAGSLCQQLEAGSIAVVEDHINLSGIHPLQGPNDDELGPRFPDMTEPYSSTYQGLARSVALRAGIPCLPGVFACVPGPSLPTRAEYRYLRRIGADLAGMSLVPEVLAAVHSGLDVLALVGITQQVQPESHSPASIEDMLDAAEVAGPRMASLLIGILASIHKNR